VRPLFATHPGPVKPFKNVTLGGIVEPSKK
jgi:hypothetical protein